MRIAGQEGKTKHTTPHPPSKKLVSGIVVSFLSLYYQPQTRPFVGKKIQETHQLTATISSKHIF